MHEHITMLMSLVLDGVATPAEKLRLDQHLATCPNCAAIWRQWRFVDDLLSTAPAEVASRSLTEEILARVEGRRQQSQRSRWLTSGLLALWVLGAGIGVLTVVLLVWWLLRHPVDVGVMLSSGAQLLSSGSWFLRGVQTVVSAVSIIGALVAWISCLTMGGALILFWLWATKRSSRWTRATVLG